MKKKIEEFFEQEKGITVDAARQYHARYNSVDMCRFAKKYHEQFIPTPSELETMAMKEFPVVRDEFDIDWNGANRAIFLSGLQAAVKMMGGEQ